MGRRRSSRGEGDQFLVLPKQMVGLTKRWWLARVWGRFGFMLPSKI